MIYERYDEFNLTLTHKKKTMKQNFAEQNLAVMESFRQNEDDMEGQSSSFLSRVSTVVQNNKLDSVKMRFG